jgi:hypothetical protein
MSQPYSVRLYSVSGINSGDGTIHTDVPAGKVMVVREVDGYSGTAGGPVVWFEDHATGGAWFVRQGPSISAVSFQWEGHLVFEADGFDIRVDSGDWDIFVSGYLLNA